MNIFEMFEVNKKSRVAEAWSQKYKSSINCSHPRGFSQKAHCAGKKKHNESVDMEMTCEDCGMCETHGDHLHSNLDEACWKGYHKEGMKKMFGKTYPNCVKNKNESLETYVRKGQCPGCGEEMVAEYQLNEKQDACYHKVKSRYKVWPSAYASGALVKCRKKGAANWGNSNESITQEEYDKLDENLKQWFSDKWVRFGPDGKIRGDCARGDSSEGKPKCLPQSKAHSLGKKGRASAAARKRRKDPNPERSGKAINVNTAKKEGTTEAANAAQQAAIAIAKKKKSGVAEGEPIHELSSDALARYKVKAKQSADELTSLGKYRQANDRTMNVMKATGKQIDNTVTNIRKALNRESTNQGMAEDAEQLNVGDDVIITGDVQFNGATGVIDSFGRDHRFVVVNLYNHGRHSFHSSDVSYNDYADSDDEQARMYDAGEFRGHTDDDIMESRLQEMRAAGYDIL
jgi:hypothetical protein